MSVGHCVPGLRICGLLILFRSIVQRRFKLLVTIHITIPAGLARKLFEQDVPEVLAKATVYALDMGALLAGTKYRGGRFAQGCAGGEHIVDQQHACTFRYVIGGECATQVATTRFTGKLRLRSGIANAVQAFRHQDKAACAGQRAGQFQRLVVAALAKALDVQRNGNRQFHFAPALPAFKFFQRECGEQASARQFSVELEARQQAGDGTCVKPRRCGAPAGRAGPATAGPRPAAG